MILKKLAVMIFLISLTSCSWKTYSVQQACRIAPSQNIVLLTLNKESSKEDYQSALVIRKREILLLHKDINRINNCVTELTK